MRLRPVWLVLAALLSASALGARASAAEPAPRVVVVRAPRTDEACERALVHLQGELEAAGFEVKVESIPDAISPKQLRAIGEREHAFATLTVLRSNGNTTADVWIGDRVTGKTSVRTLATTSPERSSKLLAIRAVDLLKTSLVELHDQRSPPPDTVGVVPPSEVPQRVRALSSRPGPVLFIRVHGAAMAYPQPYYGAFGPAIGVTYRPLGWFGARLLGVGPLLGADTGGESGTVRLSQGLGLAELEFTSWARPPLAVSAVATAGAYLLSVSGEAKPPYYGVRSSVFVFAGGLGPELGVTLTPNARLQLGARALTFAPDPVVRVYDDALPMDRFGVLASAGLELGF